ncbi:MAG: aldo/keto reductase [Clostridiales bacterium]
MSNENFKVLGNGVKIPLIGYGTYLLENNSNTTDLVKNAIKTGYRHIDTAAIYGNEEAVGKAIKESNVSREDIFLVSKVWNTSQGYESTMKAFDKSLKNLDTEYLDLYLIHWPKELSKDTWKAFEYLYNEKKVKAIGISNFMENHIEDLLTVATITPMINQVELHPRLSQKELSKYCLEKDIQLEAWSPLMQGHILNIKELSEVSKRYNKTVAQIVLRWNIQRGIVTIPKSSNLIRIESNFDIFDFELSKEDMEIINNLDTGKRIGPDPNNFNF